MKGYLSIGKRSFTEFVEKKSVFYGSAMPIKTEEEAIEFINSVKKKYSDATHNVYAYILRANNISRFSDDGEPHGTAGLPVLEVLRKEGLCDVCVVVTRYFGGILLGAGGLVRAYTSSAKTAVDAAGIVEWDVFSRFKVCSDYTDYQKLSYFFKKNDIILRNVDYDTGVCAECLAECERTESIKESISSLTNGKAAFEVIGEEYMIKESGK